MGYALGEINQMRAVFGTRPWRTAGDPLSVIAVQNFKGSVGKSTVASHLAQYLAIKGYRVCLVDCDSQGSSTAMFGYVPDLDIEEDDTLYPFFRHAEMASLAYAVRETHWDGLYLVPANLKLYSSEYELAATGCPDGAQSSQPSCRGYCADWRSLRRCHPGPATGPWHYIAFGDARRQRAAGAHSANSH